MFRIKVENPSDYVVERAARIFGPSSIAEIEVTEMQYREIKANIHLNVEKLPALKCEVCGFEAKNAGGLQSHQRAKHPEPEVESTPEMEGPGERMEPEVETEGGE